MSDGHAITLQGPAKAGSGRGRITGERRTRIHQVVPLLQSVAAEAASLVSDGHYAWASPIWAGLVAAEAASLVSDGHP